MNNKNDLIRDFASRGVSGANLDTYISENGIKLLRKSSTSDIFKLIDQFKWLERHQHLKCIPKIYQSNYMNDIFFYDMKFYHSYESLNQRVLKNPRDLTLIKNLLNCLDSSFYGQKSSFSNMHSLQSYIDKKLFGKLKQAGEINKKIAELNESSFIFINEEKYEGIPLFENRLKNVKDWLESISKRENFSIHGDLTAENILLDNSNHLIFIDPNPDNSISSISVDLAKLYQSFLGLYELCSDAESKRVGPNNYHLSFDQKKVTKYHEFLSHLEALIETKFNIQRDELIFHCLIHFCRLLPYQAKMNPNKIEVYYLQLIKIMNQIEFKFE